MTGQDNQRFDNIFKIMGVVVFLALVVLYTFFKELPEWMFSVPVGMILGPEIMNRIKGNLK